MRRELMLVKNPLQHWSPLEPEPGGPKKNSTEGCGFRSRAALEPQLAGVVVSPSSIIKARMKNFPELFCPSLYSKCKPHS